MDFGSSTSPPIIGEFDESDPGEPVASYLRVNDPLRLLFCTNNPCALK